MGQMMMMMLMGPEGEVGGGDTAEQGRAEEGGDTLEEEVESGWEESPMEQEGCKAVALQQREQAPKGFLFMTAEEKVETAVQVKRSLADSKAVSMLSQSMVVAEAESRRSQKEQERRPQGRAAVLPTRGMPKVGGDDTVEESGSEEGDYDLEEGMELSTEEEGTGAEAAEEAGQPMVAQQAEVGSDPEGKGAAREGYWIGDWCQRFEPLNPDLAY